MNRELKENEPPAHPSSIIARSSEPHRRMIGKWTAFISRFSDPWPLKALNTINGSHSPIHTRIHAPMVVVATPGNSQPAAALG